MAKTKRKLLKRKERKQKSRLKERKNLKAERQGNFLNHQKKLSRSQKSVKQMEEK